MAEARRPETSPQLPTSPRSSSARKILITGATTTEGYAVINALMASGESVRLFALAAFPLPPATVALQAQGVKIIQGQPNDAPSMEFALTGMDAALLITGFRHTPEEELSHGKTFINAARNVKLQRVVYISVDGEGEGSHSESKRAVEEYLRDSFVPHTILRSTALYEFLGAKPDAASWFFLSMLRSNIGKRTKSQFISAQDVGWFGANALLIPEKYTGQSIALAGDDLTISEVGAVYKRVKGPRPAIVPGFIAVLVFAIVPLSADLNALVKWFATRKQGADIAKLKLEHPGLMDFETWLRKERMVQTRF